LLNNKGKFCVGLLDKKIIAMGAFRKIADDTVELKRMRVHPDFQRQGYGQRILTALEKRAKELGYTTIQLDTLVKQTAARHLYEKNGYAETRKEAWTIQGEPYEVVFYQKKSLTPH
jgi:GNAT superfamily N-acetyltransferase